MHKKKVVVIGSGPGGSGLAALMAHRGHDVTLLEKNNFIGGKCSALAQDGFVVDTGVHMFGRGPNGPFGEIASRLGVKLHWCMTDPMIETHLSGKGSVHITHSLTDFTTIKSFMNAYIRGWLKIQPIRNIFKTLKNHSIKELQSLRHKLLDPNMPYLSELEDISVKDFFTSLTRSEDLLRSVHAQTMITMVVPWDQASLADFLYIHSGTIRSKGFGYPPGGSGEIPNTFLKAFRRDGGIIKTNAEVERINIEDGRAKGITTTTGEFIPAEIVVSNAGIHRTIDLAGKENFPEEYNKRADELKLSAAFIATKYFLNRKITSTQTPCMFHIPDLPSNHMFDYFKTGEIPEDLYLFITIPSMIDSTLAPLGKDLLIVGVPAPNDLSRSAQCVKLLKKAENIAETKLFPEIEGAVMKKQRSHIVQTSNLTGRKTGECIGLAQLVGQTGTRKPTPQTPIEGLLMVGSDAGGKGIGTECAAESALYVFNLIK